MCAIEVGGEQGKVIYTAHCKGKKDGDEALRDE
jgi:hypothetical protein